MEMLDGCRINNGYWSVDYNGEHREGFAVFYWLASLRARYMYRRLKQARRGR